MNEAAQSGYLNAMAAATYLVHKGVPFRTAHEKIGNAVRFAIEKGVELNALSLDELRQFGEEFGEDFFAAITLEATLDCHDVIGGTARAQVRKALAAACGTRCEHCNSRRPLMLVRKALLKDASKVYDLVNSLSRDGTLLQARLCGDLRKHSRFHRCRIRRRRLSGLRRAALLRAASVRGALDCGEAGGQEQGRGQPDSWPR